jgi:hypothetical protein
LTLLFHFQSTITGSQGGVDTDDLDIVLNRVQHALDQFEELELRSTAAKTKKLEDDAKMREQAERDRDAALRPRAPVADKAPRAPRGA